jgi:hypothetical protein
VLAAQLRSVPAPPLPEMARLPKPRERDPIAGCSRTWLIETNDALPSDRRFLFRVRRRAHLRGAVFINVAKLLAFLREAEMQDRACSES